jgi:hypothetical protein
VTLALSATSRVSGNFARNNVFNVSATTTTNLISDYNSSDVVFTFKHTPYLIDVFKRVFLFVDIIITIKSKKRYNCMNEARESVAITHSAAFPIYHTDSNTGRLFRSSHREASVSPQQITDYVQGPSKGPIRHSRLNEIVYGEKKLQ